MKVTLHMFLLLPTVVSAITIGADDRYPVRKDIEKEVHKSIGLLEIFTNGKNISHCTGTVVGPRHVITAAHCVVNRDGSLIEKVEFYPSYNKTSWLSRPPFGKFISSKFLVLPEFFENQQPLNDMALIIFHENLPVEPLDVAIASEEAQLKISGYPSDKKKGSLWEGTGVRVSETHHDVDTWEGQSGSGILESSRDILVGIHSAGGRYDSYGFSNEGYFFSEESLSTLKQWIDEN